MTAGRRLLGGLLLVVAAAAAVLSFAALRDLAFACGFSGRLAWLLPVVVDAGAAAGSIVWLGGAVTDTARRFARGLALVLLGSSVAANALGHALAAYGVRPAWWVVVLVSAVAPAVLGAVVHLAVLVGRPGAAAAPMPMFDVREPVAVELLPGRGEDVDEQLEDEPSAGAPDPTLVDDRGLSLRWADAPPVGRGADTETPDAARLIADGAGRRRLATELGISEWEARQMLARAGADTEAGDRIA